MVTACSPRLLRTSPAQSKEIYVLSDLQDSGWEVGRANDDASLKLGALVFHLRKVERGFEIQCF